MKISLVKDRLLYFLLVFLLTVSLSEPIASIASNGHAIEESAGSSLAYISDDVSFIGQDSQGYVACALDNSRGRDGDTYQAEHLVVLYDERRGWVALQGNGRYDNNTKNLNAIPASPFFRSQGNPDIGMMIVSDANRLISAIEPVRQRSDNRHGGAVLSMGTAPAVLVWQGRTIPERVIYEHFMMRTSMG